MSAAALPITRYLIREEYDAVTRGVADFQNARRYLRLRGRQCLKVAAIFGAVVRICRLHR